MFSDLKDTPKKPPTPAPRGTGPRQAMTAHEISAFDDMFNLISKAAGVGKQDHATMGRSDIMGKLRASSKKMRWTSEEDEVLDHRKEEMDMCETDHELLKWAKREIFDKSTEYEQAALKALAAAETSEGPVDSPPLQPLAYPQLLAHLMRTFREKYNDPHLALAMFDQARHLSMASYVFGCSTQAYNELIETRWSCFYDIKGVHEALQEMSVNGVFLDSRTRRLVEIIRREAAQRELWVEESQLGSGEVMKLLTEIDEFVAKTPRRKDVTLGPTPPGKWNNWKNLVVEEESVDDGWSFGEWLRDHELKSRAIEESRAKEESRARMEGRDTWESERLQPPHSRDNWERERFQPPRSRDARETVRSRRPQSRPDNLIR